MASQKEVERIAERQGAAFSKEVEEIVEHQVKDALYRLKRAEKSGRQATVVVKIYKFLVVKRPGISGWFKDLINGPILSPGSEDRIANGLITALRANGYSATKNINRRTGIVRVSVSLPSSSR